MTRERVSLAGTWSFWPDPTGRTETAAFHGEPWLVGELGAPREIPVPGSWQDAHADRVVPATLRPPAALA
jgi:hypothetical protein